jgi:hypothetical protein
VELRPEQLEFLVQRANPRWGTRRLLWLGYVAAVKQRVRRIAEAYGGVEYALQGLIISTFLGEAVADGIDSATVSDAAWEEAPGGRSWPPACALGPDDVATLLKAGLMLDGQDRQTQINNRMLLELLEVRPADFTLQVLASLGQDNPLALVGLLFALLEQDQHQMRQAIDVAALLERKLGLVIPRRRDFMAGGKRAPDSYFEALSLVAEGIMARSDYVFARKLYLQAERHPSPPMPRPGVSSVVQAAQDAIARADEVAGAESTEKATAVTLYREAFCRCSEVLTEDRLAFQLPWLKTFWRRNEEALKLLTTVRNYQNDVDRVRPWLHVHAGTDSFGDEQGLLLAVIRASLWDPADRRKVESDPLVRLLIDPEPGLYDFTVVSCMGLITEGAAGTELEDAYRRLWELRRVRVIRADTKTAMSLEDNAERVIEAFRQASGPFGYIGYSQGCANALAAESRLCGGTPEEQKLVSRLVSRNLLFSAFNGSAHGTMGSKKVLRAMIDGERFLKHYQTLFSSEAVGAFLKVVKAVVDSKPFVQVLGGVHSVSPDRAAAFHRDMQVVAHAPTSTLRGVVEERWLAEALELTFHLLNHASGGAEHDTQVLATDAVGHSTHVLNEMTALLERCDMGSLREACHHWSPLFKETEPLATERDQLRAAYDLPKDRHVFPWIEVAARFGLVRSL